VHLSRTVRPRRYCPIQGKYAPQPIHMTNWSQTKLSKSAQRRSISSPRRGDSRGWLRAGRLTTSISDPATAPSSLSSGITRPVQGRLRANPLPSSRPFSRRSQPGRLAPPSSDTPTSRLIHAQALPCCDEYRKPQACAHIESVLSIRSTGPGKEGTTCAVHDRRDNFPRAGTTQDNTIFGVFY